jgi:hypothetical protein
MNLFCQELQYGPVVCDDLARVILAHYTNVKNLNFVIFALIFKMVIFFILIPV